MYSNGVNLAIALATVFGLVFGSFYNVLIYRLPRGQSILSPRSYCPRCRNVIAWYDNIPLMSFIMLRARCRRCGHKIPARYFMVELISGMLAAYLTWHFGPTLKALWFYAFLSILLVVAFIDWFHGIIPDVLSIGGVLLGWAGSMRYLDIKPLESILGSVVGAGVLILIALLYKVLRKVDGLGGGDVKLMAMIGAFLGWKMVFPVLFLASFAGSIYGIFLMRTGGNSKTAVAFGSFLAPAAFVMFMAGPYLWQLYLGIYFH